jgi:hypothetical protein
MGGNGERAMTGWEAGTWHWCWAEASCYIDWADHWQTTNAGILAVGAALGAAWIAKGQLAAQRAQIKLQVDQEDDRRTARLRAARASLPVTLSAICEYAERVAVDLKSRMIAEPFPLARGRPVLNPPVVFPVEAIAALERLVELVPAGPVAERIESILREAQVLDARTRDLHAGRAAAYDVVPFGLIQAASIHARADSLFGYARQHCTSISEEPLWDRVFSALDMMQVHEGEWDDTLGLAREQRAQGMTPGEADVRPVA